MTNTGTSDRLWRQQIKTQRQIRDIEIRRVTAAPGCHAEYRGVKLNFKCSFEIAMCRNPTDQFCMQQTGLFEKSEIMKIGPCEMPDCDLIWIREFFDLPQSDDYFQTLLTTVQWRQDSIKRGRKGMQLPRLTAWYGNSGKNYAYSGIRMKPLPWSAALLTIKRAVDAEAGVKFNSVLLNLYRNERDSVAWHSDDEPELGKNPIIASLSFGATRRFVLKHKNEKRLSKIEMELSHGSLLLMRGRTQHHWVHAIPKSKVPIGPRLNLTFRIIR